VDDAAKNMLRFADDRALVTRLGVAAQARIEKLCAGTERAADLAAVWSKVARK